ncbi:uncharacterized protein LOC135824746 [Sycon ciliatum]|uniref:uncharacterized protein LOC135824746 n=1 Tax=Sycon ciliatum TaxID=27933 RepID=UPI0031F6EBA0
MAADVRVPGTILSSLTPFRIMVFSLLTVLMVLFLSVNSSRGKASLETLTMGSHVHQRSQSQGYSNCDEDSASAGKAAHGTELEIQLFPREDGQQGEDQLPCDVIKNVKTLLLFVGYPRSCHSLVGSILDAHPHMVVAHEYNLLGKWQKWSKSQQTRRLVFNKLYQTSYHQRQTVRTVKHIQDRYSYGIPHQWQGRYKDSITVIGDKRGGLTSRLLTADGPGQVMGSSYDDLITHVQKSLNVRVKFIHVVRNPMDNIATMGLRKTKLRNSDNQVEMLDNSTIIHNTARRYFARLVAGVEMVKAMDYPMLDIHCEDLIRSPSEQMKRMCAFLGVDCPQDYMQDSASIIHSKPSVTRNLVNWADSTKELMIREMKKHSFLEKYVPDVQATLRAK